MIGAAKTAFGEASPSRVSARNRLLFPAPTKKGTRSSGALSILRWCGDYLGCLPM